MERRVLVNYRVDPTVLAALLPAPFRPALVDGHGIAGICLLRLAAVRPAGLPDAVGMTSENAAHRIAVRWDSADGPVNGVYVPRRDTSSRLSSLAGGRLFPGWQHRARFAVEEHGDRYRIKVDSIDQVVSVAVDAYVTDSVMPGSVFADLDAASLFFRGAPVGYAATPTAGVFDGVELETRGWALRPLHVDRAASTFFDDPVRFPPGTATLDSAFLMGGIETSWHPKPQLATVAPCLHPVR